MPSVDQGPYNGRPRKKASQVKHGTYAGYKWHLQYSMPACEECKAANRAREKDRYDRRKRRRTAIRKLWGATRHDGVNFSDEEIDAIYSKLLEVVTEYEERKNLRREGEL